MKKEEQFPDFYDQYDLRPAMKQANHVGDTVYATDAHSMIMVPAARLLDENDPFSTEKKIFDLPFKK